MNDRTCARVAARASPACELILQVFRPLTDQRSTCRDLLKRHETNHSPTRVANTVGSGPPSKRHKPIANAHRPRAVQACRPCAEAKLRCDGAPPCLRCREKDIACEFSEPRLSGSIDARPPDTREAGTLVAVESTRHSMESSISRSSNQRLMSNPELPLAHDANAQIPPQFATFPGFEQRRYLWAFMANRY